MALYHLSGNLGKKLRTIKFCMSNVGVPGFYIFIKEDRLVNMAELIAYVRNDRDKCAAQQTTDVSHGRRFGKNIKGGDDGSIKKVDFMIIGAAKCGTTTLASMLSQHESINFCRRKEPYFFTNPKIYGNSLKNYHQLYDPKPGQLMGEASTSYTFMPEFLDTHEKLYEYNPELKLIYIIRDPIKRVQSHYMHNLMTGRATELPQVEVREDPAYINRTRYFYQMEPYINRFTKDQILLLTLEDMASDPVFVLKKVARFLDIDETGFVDINMEPQNVSTRKGAIRNFPGKRFVRRFYNRLPNSIFFAAENILHGMGRKILYNPMERPVEFTHELKIELWEKLEPEVAAIEEMSGYKLERVWKSVKETIQSRKNPQLS